eukprot:COSAG02_NODE_36721_length_451_cov_0.960227_2_plen_36_part_01
MSENCHRLGWNIVWSASIENSLINHRHRSDRLESLI